MVIISYSFCSLSTAQYCEVLTGRECTISAREVEVERLESQVHFHFAFGVCVRLCFSMDALRMCARSIRSVSLLLSSVTVCVARKLTIYDDIYLRTMESGPCASSVNWKYWRQKCSSVRAHRTDPWPIWTWMWWMNNDNDDRHSNKRSTNDENEK